jgi:hypothetical protein
MKITKSLFHFFGGIHLAIALIAVAAITVIIGTLLESQTGSHLLAARWTYENPFFFFLLFLFFVNILFSALRRWPFKKRHIPFLITHLGLLMMISGTMVKNRWGLQGQLTVWEGSGQQQVLLPHTYALAIEEKGEVPQPHHFIALPSFRPDIYYPFHLPQLKCKLIGYAPHVKEEFKTWIKGNQASIAGFPSIPVQSWEPSQAFPKVSSYHFALATYFPTWSILALRTSHPETALQQAYLQNLMLQVKHSQDTTQSCNLPLQQVLQNGFSFIQGDMNAILHLPVAFLEEKTKPSLDLTWRSPDHPKKEKLSLSLQGQDALLVKSNSIEGLGSPFTVDLVRPNPLLCLIEDEQGQTFFFAFDSYGRVHGERFSSSQLHTLIAYDQGFSGYGVQAIVPIPSFPHSREDKENAEAQALTLQLRQAIAQQPTLTPPLQFFKYACQKAQVDFSQAFVQFLSAWNTESSILYSTHPLPETLHEVIKHFDWQTLSAHDLQAVQWSVQLLNQLEASWKQGDHPLQVLERHHWPLLEELKQIDVSENRSLLNLIAQQISSLIDHLPPLNLPLPLSDLEHAKWLSAYFRAYGIDYHTLCPYRGNGKESFDHLVDYWREKWGNRNLQQTIVFETFVSHLVTPEPAPPKLEDQHPGIVLEVQEGSHKHHIALAYQSVAAGLKWPILNGKYAIRFQPMLRELPYRLRLRQARQIAYPQSQQIYSYECDLLISEKGQSPIEQTLSMNHVYETWDGYRFYLAGIGSSADSSLKRIQLAVNHDPAKYFLTYPGAALVFLGIVLLFWIYPSRKNRLNKP